MLKIQTQYKKRRGGQISVLYISHLNKNLIYRLDMGRKTKQIEKESKQQKPAQKTKKEQEPTQSDSDIFSQSFKERLSQFVALNTEVVALKAGVEGSDQNNQAGERRDRMAAKVEQAAAAILKDQLSSLEQWIGEQQAKLKEEIKKIQKAYEENRKSLMSTGSFSEEEVVSQLASVQKKADERQKVYDEYEGLLTRSKTIYS